MMQVIIDTKPKIDGFGPRAYIRLKPESNFDMAQIEWIRGCGLKAEGELVAGVGSEEIFYTVVFTRGERP
jgi:hypothetical protein